MKNPKKQTLEDAIIDLYLNVKVRRQEDVQMILYSLKNMTKYLKRRKLKN